jgi:hypothetical protein
MGEVHEMPAPTTMNPAHLINSENVCAGHANKNESVGFLSVLCTIPLGVLICISCTDRRLLYRVMPPSVVLHVFKDCLNSPHKHVFLSACSRALLTRVRHSVTIRRGDDCG